MKLEIGEAKIIGELDLDKFIDIMSKTQLDITKAVYESLAVHKNDFKWETGYLVNVLISGLDWGIICIGLRWRTEEEKTLKFRICELSYEDKVEYKKYLRDVNFRGIELKEIRKNGKSHLLINSFNSNPEHNIDMWIGRTTFPYPNDEWEKIIFRGDKR